MPTKKITTKSAVNPQYSLFLKTWRKMRDVFKGEEYMKKRSLQQNSQNFDGQPQLVAIETFDQYLRPTDSMRRLPDVGYQRFCDYIYRAKYYPFPLEVKSQSLGLVENQPPSFELPPQLEFMLTDATTNNESLEKVLSIMNSQQLEVSRVGVLLEPSAELAKPFNIATYRAESILDWKSIVTEESEEALVWLKLKTDEYEDNKPIYLILFIDEVGQYAQFKTVDGNAQYRDVISADSYLFDSYVEPKAAESRLDEIPFVIANVIRLGADIERPFLESVADASVSLFRASAHHEDALYWGGESTLFTKGYALGADENVYVGNGSKNVTSAEYADAKYVTMGTDGIGPRENNVNKQFDYCVSLGVDLLNKGNESGVALNIRSNVKTASLKTLSLTGALALETLLRIGAKWLNLNADGVSVVANTTFAEVRYTAEDFAKFASMVEVGAMRQQDLYTLQKQHNLTSAETFEEWENELESNGSEED